MPTSGLVAEWRTDESAAGELSVRGTNAALAATRVTATWGSGEQAGRSVCAGRARMLLRRTGSVEASARAHLEARAQRAGRWLPWQNLAPLETSSVRGGDIVADSGEESLYCSRPGTGGYRLQVRLSVILEGQQAADFLLRVDAS